MPGDVSNETAALAENRPSNVHLMGMPTGRNPIQEVVAPFEERGQGGSRLTAPESKRAQTLSSSSTGAHQRELGSPRSAIGGVIATIGHFTSDRRSFT